MDFNRLKTPQCTIMDQGYLYRTMADEIDNIWMQECILKLDNAQFSPEEFSNFARETMQRYKVSNQELYKLVLKMEIKDDDCASLATELIMDALNLSVKKLHINFLNSEPLVLPCQVFESKSLIHLFAENCIIRKRVAGGVDCLPLVSLYLIGVTIKYDMMSDILSRCPLLEYLDLMYCEGGSTILCLGETQRNIKHIMVDHMESEVYRMEDEGGILVDVSCTRFPNLTSLVFDEPRLEKTFFQNSMDKFPCLVELWLQNCSGFEEVGEISIPSLKFLIVEGMSETKLVFDVPNLCKFRYLGCYIPPLLIKTRSHGMEYCDIIIDLKDDLRRSWFSRLQEFLQNLRIVSKKISLCLCFQEAVFDEEKEDEEYRLVIEETDNSSVAPCIPVENLVFEYLLCDGMPLSTFSNLVSGLFSVCRPALITLVELKSIPPIPPIKPRERNLPIIEHLFKSVTEQANWKCGQVLFEILYDEEQTEWRPIIWEDLVYSIRLKIDGIQIRLKLELHEGLN